MHEQLKKILADNKMKNDLHSFYEAVAKMYISQNLTQREIKELVIENYRLAALAPISTYTNQELFELLDANIETFYAMYKTCDIAVFEHALLADNTIPNIISTILNVIVERFGDKEAFRFLRAHVDILKQSHNIRYFLDHTETLYNKDEIIFLIKNDLIKHVQFIDDYMADRVLPDEELDKISYSLLRLVQDDPDNFYEFYKLIAEYSIGVCEFVYVINDLCINFEYEKVIKLIKELKEFEDTELYRELVRVCIERNWLKVFDDCELDYMSFISSLYSSKAKELDLSQISKFDEDVFADRLFQHWPNDSKEKLTRFMSNSKYFARKSSYIYGVFFK